MILDRLDRAALYLDLLPPLREAFAFLARPEVAHLPDGRHEILGDRLYAAVSRYQTRPFAPGAWEAHRRYVDLQVVLAGAERLAWAPLTALAAGAYDEARDMLPLTGTGDFVTLAPGRFALLWPHDAHQPGLAVAAPQAVHKVVVKIAVT